MKRWPLVALAVLSLPAAAVAVPPGGPAENPGNPPATVTVVTPAVQAGGRVAFTGTGFLNGNGSPQKVYVKFDDHGDNGIGPFVAAADGTLKGSVALSDPEAPADIADARQDHWLRFLAGPSGKYPDNGPPRSLKAAFRVVAAPVSAVAATTLRVRGGRIALRLRAATAVGARGTASVRRAGVTLARGSFALADARPHTVRVALTAPGRRRLGAGRSLSARLVLAPSSGAATTTTVTVKGPA
jgi:hypothetical protein